MKLFGLPVPFTGRREEKALGRPLPSRGGWLPLIRDHYPGAWQRNDEIDVETARTHHAVFSCMTLIASDIAKLRLRLVERDADGVWTEVERAAFSPLLRKPNHFQTRIQFVENWILSKLASGNAYLLKQRDNRGVVTRLYVLDPLRVQPLVSDSGDVFYRLSADNIARIEEDVIVPASEIIHDRMNCLYHPLIGLSPITAAGLAAMQGLSIQRDSMAFFGNRSLPGGILSAPGAISDETAQRLKDHWESEFSGRSSGKVAVLGDGLTFVPMRMTATDAQLIEQLKWAADVVCSVFHVPPYKIGLGPMPTYANIQSLNVEYYAQALQILIESAEASLDEGLALPRNLGTEFEIKGLLRMDSVTQMDVLEKAKSVKTLNERRAEINMRRIENGDTIYLQQQDHSLEAIAARDSLLVAQASNQAAAQPVPEPPANDNMDVEAARAMAAIYKGLNDGV